MWVIGLVLGSILAWAGEPACAPGAEQACELRGVTLAAQALQEVDGARSRALMSEATASLKVACDGGRTTACRELVRVLLSPRAMPEDAALAVGPMAAVCRSGDTKACVELGQLHLEGRFGAANHAAAALAFRAACDAREAQGCLSYARLWQSPGAGVSVSEARSLFTDACFAGNMEACLEGAKAYEGGSMAEQAAGKALLAAGCDGGMEWACLKLGRAVEARPAPTGGPVWSDDVAPPARAVEITKSVAPSEITWKRRDAPAFPAGARELAGARCVVTFRVGTDGVPADLQLGGCPEAFRGAVSAAILKWRAQPFVDGGRVVAVNTTVVLKFD